MFNTGFPCRYFEIVEQAIPSNADYYYDVVNTNICGLHITLYLP
jgi:hypothetical protein